MKLYDKIEIVCVDCKGSIREHGDGLVCEQCGANYRRVNNIPVLLSANNPLFSADSVSSPTSSGFSTKLVRTISRMLPSPTVNVGGRRIARRFGQFVEAERRDTCLIIGSGENVEFNKYIGDFFETTVLSDVVIGPGTSVVCDRHQLPFEDSSFDSVVLIAVLEHVLDPWQVMNEVKRVLKVGGLLFADGPFMQQVHMGAYDFTRFTDLGYRWLFRDFEEIVRGVSVGPASALVWSIMYFFSSFTSSYKASIVMKGLTRIMFFWIKYFDYILVNTRGAYDAASGCYFLGKNKKGRQITGAQLLREYRGINR